MAGNPITPEEYQIIYNVLPKEVEGDNEEPGGSQSPVADDSKVCIEQMINSSFVCNVLITFKIWSKSVKFNFVLYWKIRNMLDSLKVKLQFNGFWFIQ